MFIYAPFDGTVVTKDAEKGESIMPGGMGTQNLPRAVGERRAKELILAAQPFGAALSATVLYPNLRAFLAAMHKGGA